MLVMLMMAPLHGRILQYPIHIVLQDLVVGQVHLDLTRWCSRPASTRRRRIDHRTTAIAFHLR